MAKQPVYPNCPCCGHDSSSVVPDRFGFFHCMLCGGDFDQDGELVSLYDDDDEESDNMNDNQEAAASQCVVIQFRNSGGFGTGDELGWRHDQEEHYDGLLKQAGLGYCDGGQGGSGSMEIFLYVNDLNAAIGVILHDLTDLELIGWAKVASLDEVAETWRVHYPPNGQFSIWEF